jgi:hypothetical protein
LEIDGLRYVGNDNPTSWGHHKLHWLSSPETPTRRKPSKTPTVTVLAAAIGDRYQASGVAGAFSKATFFIAFGQIIGPDLAGMIGSEAEGFPLAYLAAALTAIAACGVFFLPRTGEPAHFW